MADPIPTAPTAPSRHGRYERRAEIGRGGMGVVYRARDRLTGRDVALKGVNVPASQQFDEDHAVALIREFQVQSVLRHPYIISVLDYGFDAEGAPFYTMELIEGAEDIVTGAGRQPLERRLDYLLQVSEALTYLHGHGIIHRDLKPPNILLAGDRARLVDFGLAVFRDEGWETRTHVTGTALYLAPEVLSGAAPASVASDLFSLGVVAFEILAGRPSPRPSAPDASWAFDAERFAAIGLPEPLGGALAAILRRLTEPDPKARPGSAREVLAALKALVGAPDARDLPDLRESYLQASKFVGREAEMGQLTSALDGLAEGRGSAWLVRGESGIGKSRFVAEFLPRAMAAGAPVFRGQAGAVASTAYEAWSGVLRALAIEAPPTAGEAALLSIAVPGLDDLIGVPVGPAPALGPAALQSRLFATVAGLLARLDRPALVVVEDLHRAGGESVALFEHLAAASAQRPLMLLGTARSEERPELGALPHVRAIALPRLGAEDIAELSGAMLGRADPPGGTADYLIGQSEGNPFFLVETIRALSARDGEIRAPDDRAPTPLGIRSVIRARLERLAPACYPMIEYAALIGRDIDVDLLAMIAPATDIHGWLDLCAASALIEGQDRDWRFAHDKFREAIVQSIPPERRPQMHRRIAEVLDALGPEERSEEAMQHWGGAGEPARELHFATISADRALARNAITDAVGYLERALALNAERPPGPERDGAELSLRLKLGGSLVNLQGFAAQQVREAFGRAHDLCRNLGSDISLVPANWGLWNFYTVRGDLDAAGEIAASITGIGAALDMADIAGLGRHLGAVNRFWQGALQGIDAPIRDFHASLDRAAGRVVAFAPVEDPEIQALSYLAWLRFLQGFPEQAAELSDRALALGEHLGRADHMAFALGFAAWYSRYRGDMQRAEALSTRSIALAEEHAFPYWLGAAKILRGSISSRRGTDRAGIEEMEEGFAIWQMTASKLFAPSFLLVRAQAHFGLGEAQTAGRFLDDALTEMDATGERFNEAEVRRVQGLIAHRMGETADAARHFEAAMAVSERQGAVSLTLRAAVNRLWLEMGREGEAEARARLADLAARFPEDTDWGDLQAARRLLGS